MEHFYLYILTRLRTKIKYIMRHEICVAVGLSHVNNLRSNTIKEVEVPPLNQLAMSEVTQLLLSPYKIF